MEVPVTEVVEVVIDSVIPPSCDELEDATITLLEATGGSGVYEYYISNNPSVINTQTAWTGLGGGQTLSIYAIDSNGCFGQSEPVTIPLGPSCIGCTIPIACNYNPAALEDDGSCIFFCPGCTDQTACNYDAGALQDDGSCFYPESEEFCDCDGNQLDALGVCGGTCSQDIDGDAICDDIDDCIGEYDECDICNGPGGIYECGCYDIPEGIAIAMAAKRMPWAIAVAIVMPTKMQMAFVTMKTIVLGNLTSVAFATAMAFHLERATALETSSTPVVSVVGTTARVLVVLMNWRATMTRKSHPRCFIV